MSDCNYVNAELYYINYNDNVCIEEKTACVETEDYKYRQFPE